MAHQFHPKVCACSLGCTLSFTPTSPRQVIAPIHKQAAKQSATVAIPPRQSPILDYRLALRTAQEEIKRLDQEIEDTDNEIEGFRAGIASMLMIKDKAVDRHGLVMLVIETLEKMVVINE